MPTTLTSKGQVTLPKRIRDALQLLPGAPVEFSVNAGGEVVPHRPRPPKRARPVRKDRFDAVRDRADVPWWTCCRTIPGGRTGPSGSCERKPASVIWQSTR
jgi:AbrB family looped-hinge helix DNA binding protein